MFAVRKSETKRNDNWIGYEVYDTLTGMRVAWRETRDGADNECERMNRMHGLI